MANYRPSPHRADEQANFADAFARYWNRFVRQAATGLGSISEVEDAVSSAFIRAYARRHIYDDTRASRTTWLAAIVHHEVISRLRMRAKHRTVPLEAIVEETGKWQVDEHFAEEAQQQWLRRGLARLPERDRQLIALRFGQGMTNREIAAMLDANERTIGVQLLRALRRLKQLLVEEI